MYLIFPDMEEGFVPDSSWANIYVYYLRCPSKVRFSFVTGGICFGFAMVPLVPP